MIQIDEQELFNMLMDVYMNSSKFANPHIAGEYIIKQIEPIKNDGISNDTNSFSKTDFKILANNFLVETEENDKTKMPWETKNHIPTLHVSLNEFYVWLEKNYWQYL